VPTASLPVGKLLPAVVLKSVILVGTAIGVFPSFCYAARMSIRQIFENLSWETLISLPPGELLAVVILTAIALLVVTVLLLWVVSFFD